MDPFRFYRQAKAIALPATKIVWSAISNNTIVLALHAITVSICVNRNLYYVALYVSIASLAWLFWLPRCPPGVDEEEAKLPKFSKFIESCKRPESKSGEACIVCWNDDGENRGPEGQNEEQDKQGVDVRGPKDQESGEATTSNSTANDVSPGKISNEGERSSSRSSEPQTAKGAEPASIRAKLPCNHTVCVDCLKKWQAQIETNTFCPFCFRPLYRTPNLHLMELGERFTAVASLIISLSSPLLVFKHVQHHEWFILICQAVQTVAHVWQLVMAQAAIHQQGSTWWKNLRKPWAKWRWAYILLAVWSCISGVTSVQQEYGRVPRGKGYQYSLRIEGGDGGPVPTDGWTVNQYYVMPTSTTSGWEPTWTPWTDRLEMKGE